MKDLIQYLQDNFIDFTVDEENNTVSFEGKVWEFFKPNEEGYLFDEDFRWDNPKTEHDGYIFCLGGVWYTINKGEEVEPKLNRVKWRGTSTAAGLCDNFLGVHGSFELMNGTGLYKDWTKKAKFLGLSKLGICEKGTLGGALKFQNECQKQGISPVFGLEIPVKDEEKDLMFSYKLFAKNAAGWQVLLAANKIMNCDNMGFIKTSDMKSFTKDVFIIFDPKTIAFEELPKPFLKMDNVFWQMDTVIYKKEDRDEWYLTNMKKFFNSSLKSMIMCDAYYTEKEYCILRQLVNMSSKKLNYYSENQYFKNEEEFLSEVSFLFKEGDDEKLDKFYLEARSNTDMIATECTFLIPTSERHLPHYVMTEDEKELYSSNDEMLESLVYEGFEKHAELLDLYEGEVLSERIERELEVIRFGGVGDYFLILRDIVNWADKNEILLPPGRGSAAGSLVAYLLGLVQVDPLKYDLIFERFLNKGRVQKSLPDIDTDFPKEKRPLVKQYMEERFGITQVCSVGTYGTLQMKAAILDVYKSFSVPIQLKNRISKIIEDSKTPEEFLKMACHHEEIKAFLNKYPDMMNCIFLLLGQQKSPSIHACAMMIFPAEKTMYEWVPVKYNSDAGLTISEWEGGELDEAGFLKEDMLGIEQLDKFEHILVLIEKNTGRKIDIYKDIPLDDPKVYKYFGNGWNGDVFQFSAFGLSGYAQKLKPENMNDLIAALSLFRPGPMENGFHMDYIALKNGEKDPDYPIGTEEILKKTFSVICYQEQIMQICNQLADFDLVTCDTVRKCIYGKEGFWTPEGRVSIEDMFKTKNFVSVSTYSEKEKGVKKNKVASVWFSGEKDCIEIITRGGRFRCTPDHKILTEIGWLEAKDCVGHYIYRDLTRRFGTLNKSAEELYLMVALLTEGSLGNKNRCTFVNKDLEEIEMFKITYESFWGKKMREYENENGVYSLSIDCEIVERLGLKHVKSDGHILPDYVFQLNEECQSFVLAKLIDFDGYVVENSSNGKYLIGYSSKSKDLVYQVGELISCFGVAPRYTKRFKEEYDAYYYEVGVSYEKDAYKLKQYLDEYSFKFQKCRFEEKESFNYNPYLVPSEIYIPELRKTIESSGYNCNELLGRNVLAHGLSTTEPLSIDRLKRILEKCGRNKVLEKIVENQFCFDLVKSIENIGIQPVYDFRMRRGVLPYAFVGGILAHNCLGKKKLDVLLPLKAKFIEGYVKKFGKQGVTKDYAEKLWGQMEEFAKYSFNRSHAAAYAMNSYNSMWFKVNYPLEFWSVTFSHADMKDYPYYINEMLASSHIEIKPVDINKSDINIVADKETNAIYWAINSVCRVGPKSQPQIIAERDENGPYFSFKEFLDRNIYKGSAITKSVIENLIYSGAFDNVEEMIKYQDSIFKGREYLLNTYRKSRKVKIDKEKDDYEVALASNSSKIKEDWWWRLQQKANSGFGFFNYGALVERYLKPKCRNGVFYEVSDLKDYEGTGYQTAMIGGYVLEVDIKNSKKGPFASITLESNYDFVRIVVFPGNYEEHSDYIDGLENSLLLVSGRIEFDRYRQEYVMHITDNSEFIKLTV